LAIGGRSACGDPPALKKTIDVALISLVWTVLPFHESRSSTDSKHKIEVKVAKHRLFCFTICADVYQISENAPPVHVLDMASKRPLTV
jgi:hypothetical protein